MHGFAHMMLMSSGLFTQSQLQTSVGRMDTVVTYKDLVFLFEFKTKGSGSSSGSAEKALEQAKSYTEQYGDKQITCFGIVFDVENKCIGDWVVE